MRVAECFATQLETSPEAEVLVTRSGRFSATAFDELAARAAAVFLDLGVRPGDRVAASLPNDVEILAAFHGAMRIGAIWVGINQNLAPPEQAFLLGDAGASVLLAEPPTLAGLSDHARELGELVMRVEAQEFSERLSNTSGVWDLSPIDPDAAAGLAYTSGTTGRPKGAIHSQRNLLLPGSSLAQSRGWGSDLRKGDCFALTILNMQVLTLLTTTAAGGVAVIMDTLSASGVTDWIETERVNVWNGPPALLHSMVGDPTVTPEALSSLREVWSGGSATPEGLRRRFMERFKVPVIGTYGLTEAPTVVSIDPPDGEHRTGASGRLLPHLLLEVRPFEGAEPGTGELCLAPAPSGPFAGAFTPVLGYWGRPDATEELLEGGVVHTGDVGQVDEDGYVRIVDRRNLMIIRGGANIYPAEIERVLDGFEEVVASAVLGIPDERLGERVVAVVEIELGQDFDEAALLERCGTQLARYKVPERLIVVEAMPRNAMGKVDRPALTALATAKD